MCGAYVWCGVARLSVMNDSLPQLSPEGASSKGCVLAANAAPTTVEATLFRVWVRLTWAAERA